ncbi:MAG TPA: anthranilate synthase component I [Candidatus Brocadiia bacterium]|nr:anthranilate synthase component I [Candidatus Brocadiales bacterium]
MSSTSKISRKSGVGNLESHASGLKTRDSRLKFSYYPSFEEFKALARQGNLIPVYRQLFADTLTPVSAFQKIANTDYAFLLESAAGGEKMARYSFLGSNPFSGVKCQRNRVEILKKRNGHCERSEAISSDDPIGLLEKEIKRFSPVKVDGLPCFTSGAVGYVSYDAIRYVERLPDTAKDVLNLPDIYFMFYDSMIIFDHLNKTMKVVCNAFINEGKDLHSAYTDATKRIDSIIEKLRTPVTTLSDDIIPLSPPLVKGDLGGGSSNFTKDDFITAVNKCKEYIKAGDIFQVVISQRLKAQTSADPFNIYRSLRVINPSPYMFFLKMRNARPGGKDLALIGSSPEVMVKVVDGKVNVRPIAGTRQRGESEEKDDALARELIADPKERAEHIMLLDLGRNDVGRVSQYGSVHIDEQMIIERYSHVMHITSSVTGKLRDGMNAFHALKACLPAGTLSGAPKIRAMEIIEELEPIRRGPYGGAVGYIDFSGNMDTCITIRTIVLADDNAYVQAGAGIVADSVPEREYQETLNKAKGLLKAIEVAEKMNNRQ